MPTSVTIAERAARTTGGFRSGQQWPPRSGYFTPQKMPLNVIFPRPDAETQAHARHRWAHSQMRYEIPIGVQGGAWPFKYEIISAPAWLSIGQYYGDANYGVLFGTPNSTGTFSVVVRVTGADNVNSVDVTFSVQSDISNPETVDAKFTFVDSSTVTSGTGTIYNPLKTFADWYKDLQADATYHNQIVVWRGGNYTLASNAGENSGNPRLQANSKTSYLIGFPDEEPIIDMTNGKFLDDGLGTPDLFVAGITFNNYRANVNDAHHFLLTGTTSRSTFFKNRFKNIGAGLAGTDNTSPVWYASTVTRKSYIFVTYNEYENVVNNTGNNGSYLDIYRADNVLVESNTAKNCNTNSGWWIKATGAFVTVRGNTAVENITGGGSILGYGLEVGIVPHDNEICWNNFNSINGTVVSAVSSDQYEGQHYNTFIYRNAIQGHQVICQAKGANNYEWESNVIAVDTYANFNETMITSAVPNIKLSRTNTVIASDGRLLGASGFATNGWEVQQ
jgi:hypothetical protein